MTDDLCSGCGKEPHPMVPCEEAAQLRGDPMADWLKKVMGAFTDRIDAVTRERDAAVAGMKGLAVELRAALAHADPHAPAAEKVKLALGNLQSLIDDWQRAEDRPDQTAQQSLDILRAALGLAEKP